MIITGRKCPHHRRDGVDFSRNQRHFQLFIRLGLAPHLQLDEQCKKNYSGALHCQYAKKKKQMKNENNNNNMKVWFTEKVFVYK